MEEIRLMRTQTGWLALLMTAGMTLAPTALRAQGFEGAGLISPLPPGTSAQGTPADQVPPIVRGQLGGPPLDYDVPPEDHHSAFPLPLYHDRPETGGFF